MPHFEDRLDVQIRVLPRPPVHPGQVIHRPPSMASHPRQPDVLDLVASRAQRYQTRKPLDVPPVVALPDLVALQPAARPELPPEFGPLGCESGTLSW
jgi:hypothetical protein